MESSSKTVSFTCLRPFHCGKVVMFCEINFVKDHFNLPWEGRTELHLLVFINTPTLTQHINTQELLCPTTVAH